MHIRRLLLTTGAVLLLVVGYPAEAVALRPDGGGTPVAQPPAERAPDVALILSPSTVGQTREASAVGPDRASPRARWRWPLAPRPAVLRRFSPPASSWGAGHRGVDLAAAAGSAVLAVAAGRVTHVGVIAGKPTVSLLHGDDIRSTYEPVVASVQVGDEVRTGQRIGVVAATGSHCTDTCIHLGAIRGDEYVDPLVLLGLWRVRLLPLHGPPVRGP